MIEPNPPPDIPRHEKRLEVNQPDDIQQPFLVTQESEVKGDDLTKEDYDDIVNIMRENIGEGALVNESDYISM